MEGIELSSFSAGEVPQIIEAQSGARNLLTLAVDLASDVGQSLSNPSSWINIFRRTHPRLVQGGSILAVAAPIIGFILNFHESPTLTSATASASAGTSSSTAIPSQWLMNTVPGTTVSDFESFIKTLPDGGSGRRIVYETADHQWYVGRMSLEQAQDVSKHPIIDQIVSNGPTRLYQASVTSSNHSDRHQKRVQPSEIIISEQPNGPKHLRALSLPTSVSIAEAQLGVEGDNPSVRYEFESIQGAGTFIYVIDLGFDTANYVSWHRRKKHLVMLANMNLANTRCRSSVATLSKRILHRVSAPLLITIRKVMAPVWLLMQQAIIWGSPAAPRWLASNGGTSSKILNLNISATSGSGSYRT